MGSQTRGGNKKCAQAKVLKLKCHPKCPSEAYATTTTNHDIHHEF